MWGISILADFRPMGISFHAVVVFGLGKNLLFKSVQCVANTDFATKLKNRLFSDGLPFSHGSTLKPLISIWKRNIISGTPSMCAATQLLHRRV